MFINMVLVAQGNQNYFLCILHILPTQEYSKETKQIHHS